MTSYYPPYLQVCKNLRFSGISVPRDYEQQFQRAIWTFRHQRVWCPRRRQLVHLRELPESGLLRGGPVCLPEDCQAFWPVAMVLSVFDIFRHCCLWVEHEVRLHILCT